MSDSEDEGAFASADEGEETSSKPADKKKDDAAVSKDVKSKGAGEGDGAGDGQKKEEQAAAAGKEDVKKGKGKQQQRNKKKGKGGSNQVTAKEDTSKQTTSKTSNQPAQKQAAAESKKETPAEKKTEAKPDTQEKKQAEPEKTDKPSRESKPPTKPSASSPSKEKTKAATSEDKPKKEVAKSAPAKDDSKDQQKVKESEKSAQAQKPAVAAEPKSEKDDTKQAGDVRRGFDSDPQGQDIPRERDHTDKQEEVLKKLGEAASEDSGGGWGWGSWGTSILSAASNSVQTFTHQVGDGFSTIIESVESSLGVPDPEEMAKAKGVTEPTPTSEEAPTVTAQPEHDEKMHEGEPLAPATAKKTEAKEESSGEEKEKPREEEKKEEEAGGNSWFSSWGLSDVAKKVSSTGKTLASKGQTLMSDGFEAVENLAAGGIDVLETIGKKTYNTLSEHDPAFKKTRDYLRSKGSKPNLSSILRDARDQAEKEAEAEKENEEARKAHFGTLFDDYQGIAHLEALEMLSNQSEKKVHSLLNSLSSDDLSNIKPMLITIKEAFEVNEDEEEAESSKDQDFSSLVSQYLSELELGTAPDKLNKVHDMVKKWIVDFDSHETHEGEDVKSIHQKSIQALAELTAKGVEQFHKAGELVLLERDKDKDCVERAHSLARLTGVMCHEVGNLASKFVDCLNKIANKEENAEAEDVTPLVTNVYLEATNSSTYLQDAFQLLLPVLQHAAIEHSIISRQS